MRAIAFAAVLALAVVGVCAIDADVDAVVGADTDSASVAVVEVEHPTLPGLGSQCLPRRSRSRDGSFRSRNRAPRVFDGVCTEEASCPEHLSWPGHCAGMGVTCCKSMATPAETPKHVWVPADISAVPVDTTVVPTVPAVAPAPSSVPVLQATATTSACVTQGGVCVDQTTCGGTTKSGLCPGASNIKCCFTSAPPASACATQGGVCGDKSACTGTTRSGLCPGASNIVCCFAGTAPPVTTDLAALVKIPAGINSGLTRAGASFLNSKMGQPGCPLTAACFSCTCAISNTKITKNRVTVAVTPTVRITGIKPFVDAVARAMAAVKAAGATNPELLAAYNGLKNAGGLCCRAIKKSNGQPGSSWSNHSWGTAVDFYFGSSMDPRGDGKTQYGLSLIAPYFRAEKLYWAAGYSGSEEDAMHFETSVESMNAWVAAGLL